MSRPGRRDPFATITSERDPPDPSQLSAALPAPRVEPELVRDPGWRLPIPLLPNNLASKLRYLGHSAAGGSFEEWLNQKHRWGQEKFLDWLRDWHKNSPGGAPGGGTAGADGGPPAWIRPDVNTQRPPDEVKTETWLNDASKATANETIFTVTIPLYDPEGSDPVPSKVTRVLRIPGTGPASDDILGDEEPRNPKLPIRNPKGPAFFNPDQDAFGPRGIRGEFGAPEEVLRSLRGSPTDPKARRPSAGRPNPDGGGPGGPAAFDPLSGVVRR